MIRLCRKGFHSLHRLDIWLGPKKKKIAELFKPWSFVGAWSKIRERTHNHSSIFGPIGTNKSDLVVERNATSYQKLVRSASVYVDPILFLRRAPRTALMNTNDLLGDLEASGADVWNWREVLVVLACLDLFKRAISRRGPKRREASNETY